MTNNIPNSKSRLLSKSNMRVLNRLLRKAGYVVKKIDTGYQSVNSDNEPVMKAEQGRGGYLVRFNSQIVSEVTA